MSGGDYCPHSAAPQPLNVFPTFFDLVDLIKKIRLCLTLSNNGSQLYSSFHVKLQVIRGLSHFQTRPVHSSSHWPTAQVALAMKATRAEPTVHQELVGDPTVRVLVLRAAMSTAKCRSHGEQFPKIVEERAQSQLIKSLETPWSVCDLEDVIMQRADRSHFPELEACQLRNAQGIYGQKDDDLHFRKDIAVAAGDELLKALRRTAIQRCTARHTFKVFKNL